MSTLLDVGGITFMKSLEQSGDILGGNGLRGSERSVGGVAPTLEMMDYQQR